MQELKELYEAALVVNDRDDLTLDEKIEAYEAFLDKYDDVVQGLASVGVEDYEITPDERIAAVRDTVDTLLGIPPTVLPNSGIEYHTLVAEKIKSLVDQAENDESLTNMERSQLYGEAHNLFDTRYDSFFEKDPEQLEVLSEVMAEYLSERSSFYYEDVLDEGPETDDLETEGADLEQAGQDITLSSNVISVPQTSVGSFKV